MGSLIEQIRSGDKDAVKAVYQEYAKDVYNFAKSITGDHDTALAATKKTFVKLFNNIKKGEEPENIRTALLKVAYDEACSMAMPAKEAADTAKTIVPTPIEEKQAPKREEIYMPKGGYDSLQVEEVAVDETAEEIVEEAPRPRRPRSEEGAPRPRRPRPVEDGTEEAPRPRKRRPIEETEEVEEEAPRRKRPRPTPVEEAEEEFVEEPRSRKKKRAKNEEEAVPSKKRRADDDVDVYDALEDEEGYEEAYEEEGEYEKPRNKGLFIFCIILNVILILILLWFLGGLLINLGVLPEFDLGYSWFNAHIYPLF
ncbi:MAG: hypothetical protein J5483_02320 [Lachnospiraceae bacterium]|nr:hypothetical protein [Lachnospiraceae bacterium]